MTDNSKEFELEDKPMLDGPGTDDSTLVGTGAVQVDNGEVLRRNHNLGGKQSRGDRIREALSLPPHGTVSLNYSVRSPTNTINLNMNHLSIDLILSKKLNLPENYYI